MFQWFPPDHIKYVDMSFNLDKNGLPRFERKMERFVKRFKTDYKQFVVCEYFTILLKLIVLEVIRDSLSTCQPTASLMLDGFTVKGMEKCLSLLRMYVYV